MNRITVDIIITTYNRLKLLQETLESVAAQTYPRWLCWIAEDGNTEETFEAIKPFLEDDRFQYLPGEHVGFPAAPRNRGIRMGNAGYVAVLDDDDLWLPEKLEKQVEFLDSHPDCVLLGCNAFRWHGTGKWKECPLYFKKSMQKKVSEKALLRQNCLIHSSAILRRTTFEQAGLYNETLKPPIGDDYELWLRMSALGEIWSLPEPYVVFRETPVTYYSKLNRSQNYQAAANVFEAALKGAGDMPSPFSYPENARLAAACRCKKDFYLAGPRFLGRFRHELASKIKTVFNIF
ncbi:MAG: glycosyltransferase family 2 protein [Thermodesulfobacteriota bacterium]|nr:glycosyltransferase family 2 protein [Thermodesulfobacteriota bacterium]